MTSWRTIFSGREGLRAGWGLLLFCLPFAALFGLGLLMRHYFPQPEPASGPKPMTPGLTLFGEAITFAAVAFVTFLLSLLERRPFAAYGLRATGSGLRDVAAGLGWGVLALSLLVGAMRAKHALAFNGLALGGLRAVGYGLWWAAAFLFVGLFEEFFFRGYLQFTLARGLAGIARVAGVPARWRHAVSFWAAALVLSVGLFLWTHTGNTGETPAGVAAVGLAGAVFAFSLWRTGTLWWAVGFHTAWDWAQSYLYGTPDSGTLARGHLMRTTPMGDALWSGGTAGPEGSVLVIPVLLGVGAVIAWTLPRRSYPVVADQSPDGAIPPDAPGPSQTAAPTEIHEPDTGAL